MAEAKLTIVEGPNAGHSFDLAGAAVLGRDTSAGLVLEDAEASRRHASVSVEGDTVTVEDLGSTNGTFVNGERLTGSRTLTSGDKVRIGTSVLELQISADEQATRMAAAIPDPEATRFAQVRPDPQGETEVQPPEPPAAPEPPPGGPDVPTPPPIPEPAPPAAGPPPIPEPAPGPPPPPAPEPAAVPPAPEPVAAGGPPPAPESFPPAPPPGGGFEQPGGAPPPPPSFPPPAPPGAGAPPVAYQGGGGFAPGGYPFDLQVDYPQNGIARWRAFFQGLLLFPHMFVFPFVAFAAYFVIGVAWWGTTFTGRWVPGYNFVAGMLRWGQRIGLYAMWATEAYPPFDTQEHPEYPVRVKMPPTEPRIARWRPWVHWLLAFPHYIVLGVLMIGVYLALIGAFFSILFTRNYPPGIFNFIVGVQRWYFRVTAYSLWMAEEYPPFSLE